MGQSVDQAPGQIGGPAPFGRVNLPANPPSGGPPPSEGPPSRGRSGGPPGPMDELMARHDYVKSQHDILTKARGMLDHMRREMDQLTRMGDTVQPTDVIAAAGRLVGHGVGARELATIMADMPTAGGQGLAAWLAAHDAGVTQQEGHVEMMLNLTGHALGQTSMQILAGIHMHQRAAQALSQANRAGPLSPRPISAPAGQGPAMSPNALAPTGAGGGMPATEGAD